MESVKKIKAHWTLCAHMEQSSMSTAISREPLLCSITPHPVTKPQVLSSNWTVHHSALPISNQLSLRYLLILLLLSYCSAPHWALPDDNYQWETTGKWFSQETVVLWSSHLCLLTHYCLFFIYLFIYFLIRNIFLVDGASWVSLLNMRVEVSPTILVEETCMTLVALMCSFMETVYRTLDNRLRIHQVLVSLKLIGVAKTSNLFLITFFHVKCLLLNSLSPSRTPTRKKVFERRND